MVPIERLDGKAYRNRGFYRHGGSGHNRSAHTIVVKAGGFDKLDTNRSFLIRVDNGRLNQLY